MKPTNPLRHPARVPRVEEPRAEGRFGLSTCPGAQPNLGKATRVDDEYDSDEYSGLPVKQGNLTSGCQRLSSRHRWGCS